MGEFRKPCACPWQDIYAENPKLSYCTVGSVQTWVCVERVLQHKSKL